MIKLVAIIVTLAIILIGFREAPKKLAGAKNPKQIATDIGHILGVTFSRAEKQITEMVPQKAIDQTLNRVVNQVSSDATSVGRSVSDTILKTQTVTTYKKLSPKTQKEVKAAICK